ncbi:hypothetical protein THS27_14100 [Thalassospira sp. MCCC 1A01428]|nr:hypothetical protein THS27_14100 [Thalassospira sp. MCCC 1A01428]
MERQADIGGLGPLAESISSALVQQKVGRTGAATVSFSSLIFIQGPRHMVFGFGTGPDSTARASTSLMRDNSGVGRLVET